MSEFSYGSFGEKPSFLQTLTTVLSILFPIGLLAAGFVFLYLTQGSFVMDFGDRADEVAGTYIPSEILDNKYKYKGQELAVRGEVGLESITCSKGNCPQEDPCCGCPDLRNLIIFDPGGKILRESGGVLRLLTPKSEPMCERSEGSCEYICPDWEIGAIYVVDGVFHAEPPPRGTALSLFFEYYFEVTDKRQIEGTGLAERGRRIVEAIKDMIEGVLGSGSTMILQD